MKRCLGTAQFGMDYGIRGRGRPTEDQVYALLCYAMDHGVDCLDTAAAYGDAEAVLGGFFRAHPAYRDRCAVVSKAPPDFLAEGEDPYPALKRQIEGSLTRLGLSRLSAYLLHNAAQVHRPEVLDALRSLKDEGWADRVGVSVYEVSEARAGILSGKVDLLQIPASLYDQRMLRGGVLNLAVEHGVALHSRSAFLQGIDGMNAADLPPFLQALAPRLAAYEAFTRAHGLSRIHLSLAYVDSLPGIERLVFGVDDMAQLEEDLRLFGTPVDPALLREAAAFFADIDPDLVMPSKWRKT